MEILEGNDNLTYVEPGVVCCQLLKFVDDSDEVTTLHIFDI